MDFLNHMEWFLTDFPPFSFTVYKSRTVETVRGCVSLKKYNSRAKAEGVTKKARRKTLKTFVWISSKNSASVQKILLVTSRHEMFFSIHSS
jgi:hypothetical protein